MKRRSVGSASAGFRRSSRTAFGSACEAAFVAALLFGCGGAGAGVTAENIPFTDQGSTQQSGSENGARVVVATDPVIAGLGQLARREDGRLYIAVFAGAQRTGGYAVRVVRIDRSGDTLTIHATMTAPSPDALTIQVLTSPAQLVSVDRQSTGSARTVVLVDQTGTERARATVPQSRP